MITMQALYTDKPGEIFNTHFDGILFTSNNHELTIWKNNDILHNLTGVEVGCTEDNNVYYVAPNLILTFKVVPDVSIHFES